MIPCAPELTRRVPSARMRRSEAVSDPTTAPLAAVAYQPMTVRSGDVVNGKMESTRA